MLRKFVTDFKINCIVFRTNNNQSSRNIIKGMYNMYNIIKL